MVRDGSNEICCKAGNVSEFGILLFFQREVSRLHPSITLTFTLPSITTWLEVKGKVVRQSIVSKRTSWGVEFIDLPDDVQHVLRDFVFEYQKRGAKPPPAASITVPKPVAAPIQRTRKQTVPMKKRKGRGRSNQSTLGPDEVTANMPRICLAACPSNEEPTRKVLIDGKRSLDDN